MAATFDRTKAKIQEIYTRREFAGGGQKYIRLPYNLITHDDGQDYIEPVATVNLDQTWEAFNSLATDGEFLILDRAPWAGITEIR